MEPRIDSTLILASKDTNIGKAEGRSYEDDLKVEKQISTKGGISFALGIVADGIGGENAGERAAALTVDGVFEYCQNSTENSASEIPQILKRALEKVNADVFKEAQQQRTKKNMGSTAAVAAICNKQLYIANVGDSRIYLVRGKKITQLTVDHTWEREVVQEGKLSPAEAARHPRRDELVRSVGYAASIKVDLGLYVGGSGLNEADASQAQGLQLLPGDKVVICSDGLIKSVPKRQNHFVELPEIVEIVTKTSNDEAPKQLVQKALDRNVNDNVSVIVMEVPGGIRPFKIPVKFRAYIIVIVAVLITGILGYLLITHLTSTPPAPPSLPAVTGNQVYIAQVWNLKLTAQSANGSSESLQTSALLSFDSGEIFQTTGGSGNGYAYLGFPGQAQLYLAGDTSITLKNITDAQFEILLNQGWILLNQPGRNFLVDTPNGAQAWITGSMMGLHYDASSHELYVDCLQDVCGIGGSDTPLLEGSHAILLGNQVVSTGIGNHNEYWQFVPNLVATPTSTITMTITMTPSKTPNLKATQACRYYKSLGTPCPPAR